MIRCNCDIKKWQLAMSGLLLDLFTLGIILSPDNQRLPLNQCFLSHIGDS